MRRLLLATLFLSVSFVYSQTQPIVTDRPDQTESASTVQKEHIQIETGVVYTSDEINSAGDDGANVKITNTSLDLATTLFRYGLFDSFEVRIGTQYSTATTEYDNTHSLDPDNLGYKETTHKGINGLNVGGKLLLAEEKGALPQTAVLFNLSLPVGNENLIGVEAKVSPQILFLGSNTLSENYGLGYNLGAELINSETLRLVFTVALGAAISEKVHGFVELFGDKVEDTDAALSLDAGLTYSISNRLQLDGSFGLGLTDSAPDWFVGGGIAVRIPD